MERNMISSLVKLLINISVVRNFVILRRKVVQNFEAKIFISLHRAHVEANEKNFRCALAQIVLDVKKKGLPASVKNGARHISSRATPPRTLFQAVVNNSEDDGEQAPRWRHRDQTP